MLLFLSLLGAVSSTCASQPPLRDGFYRADAKGELGEAVHYEIRKPSVTAQDNRNTRFHGQFLTPMKPSTGDDFDRTTLVVGERRFSVRRSGWDATDAYYDFDVDSRAAADSVATFLKTKTHLRVHPGYRLATSFVPAKNELKRGEPAILRLVVDNVGDKPVYFREGGMNRGARDNQFSFVLIHGVKAVPDTGDPQHFGGISTVATIPPGGKFEKEVDLSGWFDTTRPGAYAGIGTYAVEFSASKADGSVVWRDLLAGTFDFQRRD